MLFRFFFFFFFFLMLYFYNFCFLIFLLCILQLIKNLQQKKDPLPFSLRVKKCFLYSVEWCMAIFFFKGVDLIL